AWHRVCGRPRRPPDPPLDDACRFQQTHNSPGLVTGDRTTFRDFHEVALVVLVVLVVSLVACRTDDNLAKHRVLNTTLDVHHHGLVHLVADDTTDQRTLVL